MIILVFGCLDFFSKEYSERTTKLSKPARKLVCYAIGNLKKRNNYLMDVIDGNQFKNRK